MAGIQDFIGMASSQLGIGEKTAESATGGLLNALKSTTDGGDFKELLGKIPGAADLVGKKPEGGGGGLMGGLAGMAGGLLGGDTGGAMGLVSTLTESGLDMSKAGSFVGLFVDFAKKQAGDGLVGKLLSAAPDVAQLVG